MAAQRLAVLWVAMLACAPSQPPPPPAEVPRFTPRVPDDRCPSVLPRSNSCTPAWIERCDAAVAACRTTDECLETLAAVPNVCAWRDDAGPCLSHVEEVLRGGESPLELDALIEASLGPRIAQQYPARRVIGAMDDAQLDRMKTHDDALAAIWSARPVEPGTAATERRWSVLERARDDAFSLLVLEGGESPWTERVLALGEQHRSDLDDALDWRLPCHAGRSSLQSLTTLLERWPVGDRRIVRDALAWPDWQLQVVAIEDVARTRDVQALPILDRLASEHWSAIVRTHARAASHELRTGVHVQQAIEDDHGVDGCRPQPGGRWYVKTRHGPREIETPKGGRPETPQGTPAIPPSFGEIAAALPIAEGWYVATSRWEGEGSLLFVHKNGRMDELLRSPVAGLLATPFGEVAIVDEHLSAASVMTLGWSEPTEHLPYERGAYVHFHVRLPAGVSGFELGEDGVLTIVTHLGVVELDADGTMTLLPCAGAP